MTTIADNVQVVQKRIVEACDRSNRDFNDVKLVAVSKRKPVSDILEALEVGVQHFGENRVEELEEKISQLKSDKRVVWHMLGHIQSRKAKSVASLFPIVHSIDSVRIAEKLAQSIDEDRQLDAFIQINVSGEETKGGLEAFGWKDDGTIRKHLWQNVQSILQLPQLNVIGLMTMAPIVTDVEHTRPFFSALATLRDELQDSLSVSLSELSMGMTDDYPVAIEEGATIVRIGRAIFGERKY